MLGLIEKQQVRRRTPRLTATAIHRLPALVRRPSSIESQRRIAKREYSYDRIDESRTALHAVLPGQVSRTSQPSGPAEQRGVRTRPAALSAAVTIVVVGLITLAIVGARHHSAVPPVHGVVLPPDQQIEGILASYSSKIVNPKPDLVVRIPNPRILETLKTTSYTMKSGDTLSAVAAKFHVSVATLISFNGISDVRRLTAGAHLKIPSMDGTLYRVQRGDTLGGIARREGVKLSNILDANAIKSPVIVPGQELFLPGGHMAAFALRKALGTLFVWPTKGVISSPFGMRHDPFTGTLEFHNGIDIADSIGTPVDAAMDGRVALIGRNRGYGIFVILDNGNGFQTLYGHLYRTLVQKGEQVSAGQEIALMGDTGYATGPHLHFTIYKNSVPVNPLHYLPKR